MTVELVGAQRSHIGRIARRMRAVDRAECAAMGHTPRQALAVGLRASEWALTAMVDGSPHAMLGVVAQTTPFGAVSLSNVREMVGHPWFLGTDAVLDHARELLLYGPRLVERMDGSFRRLENVVSADNDRAIAFLGKLGFEVGSEAVMHGGVPFVRFWRGG